MTKNLLVVLLLLITGCTSQEAVDFQKAKTSIDQKHYRIALSYLDRVIKRNAASKYPLEAAREGAKISFYELRDYIKAVGYYDQIVLLSSDEKERVESQKQIAEIYFNDLQNYQQAILEYSKLLLMPITRIEAVEYKMNVARAHYHLNNFFQAESEIEELLKTELDVNTKFNLLLLKGNIKVAHKEFAEAADIFKELISKYPSKSVQENIGLTLAVCYEEKADFKGAIAVLEGLKNTYRPPEYIQLRIKRLHERMKNAPGAKGFRK